MSDIKISEMPEATELNNNDLLMVVQNGVNKKAKIDKIGIAEVKSEILKLVFPIGSTYVTPDNTNPNSILGFGEWERLKGKVCLGLDEEDADFDTIGKTGGEKEHTLTIEEMPSHNHRNRLSFCCS